MTITQLPSVSSKHIADLNETLRKRRSIRSFKATELSLNQISNLLWAAQGITASYRGFRTAPSAGALYPLELYLIKKDGTWHYLPHQHAIELISEKNLYSELSKAAFGQSPVRQAPINIIITAVYKRVTAKYGTRGIRYSHIEAGHAAQNLLLESTALGLGAVPIGAFHDEAVKKILQLHPDETPIYIIPVGYKK